MAVVPLHQESIEDLDVEGLTKLAVNWLHDHIWDHHDAVQKQQHIKRIRKHAYVGDRIIGAVLGEWAMHHGYTIQWVTRKTTNKHFRHVAKELGINPWQGATGKCDAATMFEAVAGAIYAIMGFEQARAWVLAVVIE